MDGQGEYWREKDICCVGGSGVFKENKVKMKREKEITPLDKALKVAELPFNNLQKKEKVKQTIK